IWCEYKYGKCHSWILENINNHKYDLFLLMDIDLPWEYDKQRENPNQRKELFDLYLKELKDRNFPFKIISGKAEKRLSNAIEIINSVLDKKLPI
ncbi:MAG: AAA family ATPase, partial [Bacteroidales bacterium]|nr:AAA family ATPase [Bacteroidales bacterium]